MPGGRHGEHLRDFKSRADKKGWQYTFEQKHSRTIPDPSVKLVRLISRQLAMERSATLDNLSGRKQKFLYETHGTSTGRQQKRDDYGAGLARTAAEEAALKFLIPEKAPFVRAVTPPPPPKEPFTYINEHFNDVPVPPKMSFDRWALQGTLEVALTDAYPEGTRGLTQPADSFGLGRAQNLSFKPRKVDVPRVIKTPQLVRDPMPKHTFETVDHNQLPPIGNGNGSGSAPQPARASITIETPTIKEVSISTVL
jgi:hypothetical protein